MMPESLERPRNFYLISLGNLIQLDSLVGSFGEVTASFERTFYVHVCGQLICFARIEVDQGPVTISTSVPKSVCWFDLGVKVKTKVKVTPSKIYLPKVNFLVQKDIYWDPPKPGVFADPQVIKKRLQCLAGIDSMSGLSAASVLAVASSPMMALRDWLSEMFPHTPQGIIMPPLEVTKLIGLGPGLTPSGDDFLGGVMITLNSIGRNDICAQLWKLISNQPENLTGSISRTFLKAASRGFGSNIIHQFLVSLLNAEGRFGGNSIKNIGRIGHTSGWDTLIGSRMTLEVWVGSKL